MIDKNRSYIFLTDSNKIGNIQPVIKDFAKDKTINDFSVYQMEEGLAYIYVTEDFKKSMFRGDWSSLCRTVCKMCSHPERYESWNVEIKSYKNNSDNKYEYYNASMVIDNNEVKLVVKLKEE